MNDNKNDNYNSFSKIKQNPIFLLGICSANKIVKK